VNEGSESSTCNVAGENKSATTEKRIAEQRKQKNEFDRTEKNCIKTPRCDLIIGLIFKGNYMQELLRK